jgi:hypothetical protein
MPIVRYKTDDTIFYFDLPDVLQILRYLISEDNVPEASKLLEKIHSHPAGLIHITSSYFRFIILDLFKERKGTLFCKPCQKTYSARDLRQIPIGSGESPFSIKQCPIQKKGGILRRLFGKRIPVNTFG